MGRIKNKQKQLIVSQDNKLIQKISTDYSTRRNLTQQSFVLDTYQKRLVALMISHIKPKDTEFPVEVIPFNVFAQFMGIGDGGKQYNKIYESISDLIGMSFAIEIEPGVTEFYHWIAGGCRVDKKEKKIYIQLDPALKKFLTGKKRNFTKYELGFIMQLKRKYSCRLYEYLRSMVNFGCANLNVDTFSQAITDGKYTRPNDLIVRVIEPALEEINATTDIAVSCEVVRSNDSGRGKMKTTGFKFHITEKSHEEKQIIMGTWGIPFEDILLLDEGQRPDFSDLEPEPDLPFKCD